MWFNAIAFFYKWISLTDVTSTKQIFYFNNICIMNRTTTQNTQAHSSYSVVSDKFIVMIFENFSFVLFIFLVQQKKRIGRPSNNGLILMAMSIHLMWNYFLYNLIEYELSRSNIIFYDYFFVYSYFVVFRKIYMTIHRSMTSIFFAKI